MQNAATGQRRTFHRQHFIAFAVTPAEQIQISRIPASSMQSQGDEKIFNSLSVHYHSLHFSIRRWLSALTARWSFINDIAQIDRPIQRVIKLTRHQPDRGDKTAKSGGLLRINPVETAPASRW